MEEKELKEKIRESIKLLFLNDCFLVENDCNERSVTHKLAEYLQQRINYEDYCVDCEYNKMKGDDLKPYIAKRLNLPINKIDNDDTEAKTVYPDIVIHRRGNNEKNLLIIEVKKNTNHNQEDINFDIKKIKNYIKELNYEFGLFIKIEKSFDKTFNNLEWYYRKDYQDNY